ncbi:MAG TPA: M10 family metallopeptidase C-terminal domain-containing protein, partial [Allosphingosinicella sp.]
VYDNAGTPVIIGKIAGFGTANMTVSAFTSEATLARLNDLVDDFGYIIVGDNPTPGDKTVTMTFNDGNNVGNGGTLAKTTVETQTLTVTVANDLPTISNLAGDAPTFTEGGPPVWLDVGDNAVVADPDNANFDGHDLTVAISAGYHFGDRITTGPDVTLSNLYNPGSTVTVDGAVIGTIQSTAAGTLGIALNSNATLARVQILVRDFTFQTPSQDPTSDTRSIQLTIDNHAGNAVTVNSSVNVVAVDDPPVANPDNASTAESATVNIAVLTNDTELDGPPLAVAEINGIAVNPGDTVNLGNGATAKLELGGSITYNPNGAFNWLTEVGSGAVNTSAVQIFTYKLVGGTATTNVSVTVNGQISSDDILYGDAGDNVINGTPQRDIFRVEQGGNDTVNGLETGDTFYFGKEFTAGDTVNGGGGADAIILQGNYPALTFGTGVTSNINSVESISLAPGNITAYGDNANAYYDYNLTTLNANVAAGGLLKVNGFLLRAGEDLTFNGAAETDGNFILLAGLGVDNLTGGDQGDVFVFGHDGRFGSSDVVNGGAGYDSLYLRGDYALDFTSAGFTGAITGIDSITLASTSDVQFVAGGDGEFDYSIVWKDSMLATGATITVNGAGLGTAETMAFNGALEGGGHFRLWGGAADDTLTGGGGNDLIFGGRGADQLRGNGGADTFRYHATNESPIGLANVDTILDFVHGVDKIDLSVIDANTVLDGNQAFTFIGSAAFTAAGPNSAGQLRAIQTDVVTNTWQVHGDTDGNGAADFVLQVIVDPLQSLTVGDFVL